ncbi:Uncharacterised protein g11235 [Pycnogonum litorale]
MFTNRVQRDVSEYDEAFPSISLPKKIGHFSTDGNSAFHDDDSQKLYLHLGDLSHSSDYLKTPLDVKCSDDRYVPFNEDARIKPNILPWMKHAKTKIWDAEKKRLKYDFVMTAGTLTDVFTAPYDTREPVIFSVYKLNDAFYVTCKEKDHPARSSRLSTLLGKAGHVFELHMTSPTLDGEPDPFGTVNENEQFYHVNETKIKSHRILYSVNVDCVDVFKDVKTGKDVEEAVELCVAFGTPDKVNTFTFKRYKLLRYWAEGFIGGYTKTVCGLRDENYIVNSIKIFETSKLPHQAKDILGSRQQV